MHCSEYSANTVDVFCLFILICFILFQLPPSMTLILPELKLRESSVLLCDFLLFLLLRMG